MASTTTTAAAGTTAAPALVVAVTRGASVLSELWGLPCYPGAARRRRRPRPVGAEEGVEGEFEWVGEWEEQNSTAAASQAAAAAATAEEEERTAVASDDSDADSDAASCETAPLSELEGEEEGVDGQSYMFLPPQSSSVGMHEEQERQLDLLLEGEEEEEDEEEEEVEAASPTGKGELLSLLSSSSVREEEAMTTPRTAPLKGGGKPQPFLDLRTPTSTATDVGRGLLHSARTPVSAATDDGLGASVSVVGLKQGRRVVEAVSLSIKGADGRDIMLGLKEKHPEQQQVQSGAFLVSSKRSAWDELYGLGSSVATEEAATAARDRCAADPGRQLRILDGQGNTPLLLAARLDDADAVAAMAAAGWEMDMRNYHGESCLHLACHPHNRALPPLLPSLAKQSRLGPDPRDVLGRTPLHAAAGHGNTEALRVLLSPMMGADATAADNQQRTALHLAAAHGKAEAVCVLLEAAPALAHATDKRGMTPLHLAALHDAPLPVLRALLWGGADPRALDAEGDTAAEVAALHGHPWTRRALEAMFQSLSSDPATEEGEEAWVPPTVTSGTDPSEVVKPPKQAPAAAFRVRLRVAGGRELVWDAGEVERLELEGAHVVELGTC